MEDFGRNLLSLLSYEASSPMLFSSGTFWALFIIFMPIYGMLRKRLWQMVVFVLAFSLYFYYKSSGGFVAVLAGTSLIDWSLSHLMSEHGASRLRRRLCLAASLLCSLSILAWFKYANFFLWNFNALIGGNLQPLDLILPVGISFYTFQSVSYVIDVYKGTIKPTDTWLEYAFFLTYFPALVAGPIVRASYFLPQIRENRHATREEVYRGLWLIITGIVKKAIIADYIAQYNDLIFQAPGMYSGFETLMGVIGYTMQIYCDFSGYSDMAIGISLIMGFKLAPNFNLPYKSLNLTEFWRRWHISLSSWLRDYIYIPLGGNRKGRHRTYMNTMVTMLIGGLWHGAAWKFIFWGGMHGAGLAVHKASRPYLDRLGDTVAIRALSWLLTMSFVAAMWVFFRADSMSDSFTILGSIFRNYSPEAILAFASARTLWFILMLVIITSHALPADCTEKACAWFIKAPWLVKLLIFIILVQLVLELRGEEVAPFIYFRF